MENSLVTYGFNNSAQSSGKKKIGNVTTKNYLKESLSSILCSLFSEKVPQERV